MPACRDAGACRCGYSTDVALIVLVRVMSHILVRVMSHVLVRVMIHILVRVMSHVCLTRYILVLSESGLLELLPLPPASSTLAGPRGGEPGPGWREDEHGDGEPSPQDRVFPAHGGGGAGRRGFPAMTSRDAADGHAAAAAAVDPSGLFVATVRRGGGGS
jgi:hypothetical protein